MTEITATFRSPNQGYANDIEPVSQIQTDTCHCVAYECRMVRFLKDPKNKQAKKNTPQRSQEVHEAYVFTLEPFTEKLRHADLSDSGPQCISLQ